MAFRIKLPSRRSTEECASLSDKRSVVNATVRDDFPAPIDGAIARELRYDSREADAAIG
jgi:hypothetical protein